MADHEENWVGPLEILGVAANHRSWPVTAATLIEKDPELPFSAQIVGLNAKGCTGQSSLTGSPQFIPADDDMSG